MLDRHDKFGCLSLFILLSHISLAASTMSAMYCEGMSTIELTCAFNKGYLDEGFITSFFDTDDKWVICVDPQLFQIVTKNRPHLIINMGINQRPSLPESFAQKIAKEVNQFPYKMIWLYKERNDNMSCEYFINFTQKLIRLTAAKIGIVTNGKIWQSSFGNINECTYFGQFSLNYQNYLVQQFKPFGGWTSAYLQTDDLLTNTGCGFSISEITAGGTHQE